MRQAGSSGPFKVLLVMLGVAAIPNGSAAQEPSDELTPRAIADSTYAVRVALDGFAESIRRGQIGRRQVDDPEVAAAVTRLASAAARRTRPRPHPALGVLWDFQMEVAEFQAVAPEILRAQVRVFLATAGDSVSAPVTLTFRRSGDRWGLVAHERLVERLAEMALRATGGTTP